MFGSPYSPVMFSPVVVRMPSSDEMLGSSSSPLTITDAHQEWIKQIEDGSLPRDAGVMPTTPRPLQVPFNRTTRFGVSIAYLDTNTKYVKNLRVTDVRVPSHGDGRKRRTHVCMTALVHLLFA